MIDKKPFSVTNEEAKRDMDCHIYTDCESCPHKKENVNGCDTIDISFSDYAADLLDARELIDKQEAIIKEMREVLSGNLRDMDKIDQICAMAGVHPYTIMRSEIAAILENTKDYA